MTAGDIQSARHAGLRLAAVVCGRAIWTGTKEQFHKYDCTRAWYKVLGYTI